MNRLKKTTKCVQFEYYKRTKHVQNTVNRIELNRIEKWCTYVRSAILRFDSIAAKAIAAWHVCVCMCACVWVCVHCWWWFFSFNFKFNCQNTRQLRGTIRAFSPPKITTKQFFLNFHHHPISSSSSSSLWSSSSSLCRSIFLIHFFLPGHHGNYVSFCNAINDLICELNDRSTAQRKQFHHWIKFSQSNTRHKSTKYWKKSINLELDRIRSKMNSVVALYNRQYGYRKYICFWMTQKQNRNCSKQVQSLLP